VDCHFTPAPRPGYRLGVPRGGFWRETRNRDARDCGGSGMGNAGIVGLREAPRRTAPSASFLHLLRQSHSPSKEL
jgi:1,4-alpha-glucan branching enzyme